MDDMLKTPLSFDGQEGFPQRCALAQVFDSSGADIASMSSTDDPAVATEYARRIVACVNALAGIDDPRAWIDNARFYSHETVSAITQQRDDLLAALQSLLDVLHPEIPGAPDSILERAKAVAARAEGREVTR